MPFQAIYVHGSATTAVTFPGGAHLEFSAGHRLSQVNSVPWSDITGFRDETGAVFRCGDSNDENFFLISIPTPVWRDPPGGAAGVAKLVSVSLFFGTENEEIQLRRLQVFDSAGIERFDAPMGQLGQGLQFGDHQTLNNRLLFDVPARPRIDSAIVMKMRIVWRRPGIVRFVSAGAGFEVPA